MSLNEYNKKRKFQETPEPEGTVKESGKNIYVVQKHKASRLHYDFRIEYNGVLKSWAIPKGPSINPSNRRLAIETEDHPLDYADFEGIIPEGNYGAGSVIIWDYGAFENHSMKDGKEISLQNAYKNGHMTLILGGKRLEGEFALIKMKRDNQWLLVKKDDNYADRGIEITKKYNSSVFSSKSLEDLANDK
ncbi:MAG: hypothetical protein GF317_15650 [Candidatus Lokiarchaeota archaeon]|nr:hypothetical protein [Candidatus Lokiarchaeota archaeon]MBD3200998.1 hypothetical protein [Candidatus Lokiarchaeota archaeon]